MGRPVALKAHLANECLACPEDIIKYWRDKLSENTVNYTRKMHFSQDQTQIPKPQYKQTKIVNHFSSDEPLPPEINNRIDCSLLKAWVMAGIPFEVVENPFVLDLFKNLNPAYIPPSRTTLSGRLLNEEISRVNKKVTSELEIADSLTLSLKDMKINIERLQIWCKTRWVSLYMTADSILCARPVFDWILLEHNGIVTNSNVYLLIQDEEFFTNCLHIRSIWAPIKECINILEAKSASLADCFVQMIKLAIAIFRLPSSNPFKASAIQIFNHRYLEFQHPAYLLCYFLHPYYRGLGLNDEGFRNAAITATTLWQNLGYSEQECRELLTQFRKYDQKLKPYDLSYDKNMDTPELWWSSIRSKPYYLRDLALRLFCIAVSQAGCERNFSVLKWIIGDRRTRLDVQKLEGISKIRSYYLASIKNELSYYGKHLDEAELREVANTSAVGEIIALDDNDNDTNYLLLEEDQEREGTQERTTLILEDIIDFTQPIFENAENVDNNTNEEINIDRNMDFSPIDLVNQILEN
ncbi:ribonuclease H-like domain-containing protein [Rhizophagus irregularis DAOM 181602=DAOM 197198]|uniref:Ribonuclease H-like domain-containing protein n=1 Tax=Rhizophagus irregularis (strain DAOM 181602 / DAOM 197198 / MUCL 43194) TaxID=747089 RepID=A0A2P4Q468_RHIID|nr:ribonuclease H-like domain-containing protein [Rhizophagus irregularis DAOM 181602=DAOM 197198]POG72416.1 ribonuclease H-like domain-containing protein [Rhizophagus irregularis DAOM 181602=DAOM 197198]|eukprot:XP_025179282.1 ribonuclease H-like domain-containing protein [Rhizophagus irregularis DAOM 181602=DAOM 197198]